MILEIGIVILLFQSSFRCFKLRITILRENYYLFNSIAWSRMDEDIIRSIQISTYTYCERCLIQELIAFIEPKGYQYRPANTSGDLEHTNSCGTYFSA
jgi:hypothetical protein